MTFPRVLSLFLCCLLAFSAAAQDRLLSPAEFLGYELGTRFTPHHRVIDYVTHVAEHAPNVRLDPYGETYEGRPLVTLYIASAQNMARLDEVRHSNLRLTGLEAGDPDPSTVPAIVWLSYNVHGNESVSTEASMATLYDLANPQNARTQAWLENTVVVMDPCINPDGRDRYVNWYQQVRGKQYNAYPEAREHHEPWPGGRTNHYYFDLNRDWAWMSQQETQQRLVRYHEWMPHVHVDFHEQGVDSPYYFAPAAEPYHESITDFQRSFQGTVGRNHMRYFDANNWLYFTRQVFDLYYPGYGDTWPIFNGAVGMTYEQGGSGRAGLGILTAEQDTLTLVERIAHHHTTGLSTIEAASDNQRELVDNFYAYYRDAQANPPGAFDTYVIKPGESPDMLLSLADHLERQGIRYGFAGSQRQARGFSYRDGGTRSFSVSPGDLVVSAHQPKSVLVKVLFEPSSSLADSLTYDITAWALPYAYGLEAYAVAERLDAGGGAAPARETGSYALDRPYAYLAEWKSVDDLRFLAAVLRKDVRLRYTTVPFDIDGRHYERGTLILTRTNNQHLGDRFDAIIREAAERLGQPLHAVATGAVTAGSDFGSGDVPPLQQTRVALLSGEGTSSYTVGEVWHYFDRQIDYPVTLLYTDDFDPADLHDYDVLILPQGSYGRVLTDSRMDDLKAWIRDGGRLIALDGAVGFFAGKEGFEVKQAKQESADTDSLEARLRRYGDRERDATNRSIPGSIFRVQLDNTHPLAYGYTDHYFTVKQGSDAYTFLKEGWNVGVLREDAHVSGFAGQAAREKLEDTLVFGVQNMGRGSVIYMVDNPLFRAFWENGKLLFGNAVFMSGR